MRFSPLAVSACLAFAASCATPCPDAAPQAAQQRFACADGSYLDVTFDRATGRANVSEDGGASLTLAIQIAGAGYRYYGAGAELRSGRNAAEAQWSPPTGPTISAIVDDPPARRMVTCTVVN